MSLEHLQYPIGRFKTPEAFNNAILNEYITTITAFPEKMKQAVKGLNDAQLDTPYRPQGWTIRQVVHHCADSHMHSLLRLKWTLTEENTIIKPYPEALWAELADTKTMPVDPSLSILEGVHTRWVTLLKAMRPEDFQRFYSHPQYQKQYTLAEATALYAWHCEHHLAHVVNLLKAKGWN
jgi:hypothetical protein